MRYCGSIDTVESYQRISGRDASGRAATESRRIAKLGDENPASIANKPKCASERFDANKVSDKLRKANTREMDKIGFLDMLSTYGTFLQASIGPPISIGDRQELQYPRYPSTRFVHNCRSSTMKHNTT